MNPDNQANPVSGSGRISVGSWIVSSLIAAIAGGCVLAFVPKPFELSAQLAMVDQYSPPELQKEAAEKTEQVVWRNAILLLMGAGLAWGLIQSMYLTVIEQAAGGGKLLVIGLVAGAVIGAVVGQLGLSMRSLLNSESVVGSIQDPIYRDALLFLAISMVFSMIPAALYLFAQCGPSIQQAVAILIAAGLGGALVPIVASLFPGLATNLFPPSGSGMVSCWFAVMGLMVAVVPGLLSSKSNTSGDQHREAPPAGNADQAVAETPQTGSEK